MLERIRFVELAAQEEHSVPGLCELFGVSRAEGYRVLKRFREEGYEGLVERSRRPRSSPMATPPEIVERILQLKRCHPHWGPKKIMVRLIRLEPERKWPSPTTAHRILRQHGLVASRRRQRRHSYPHAGGPFKPALEPNDVWTTDFKGQFRLGNGRLCYPLTLGDLASRFALKCEALNGTTEAEAWKPFDRAFREYGLPRRMRSDNGVPFASRGLCGLSRLSVWWLKLGIELERIDPGQPQQNGAHERAHRTLKAEATRPPERSQRAQQRRFDSFREIYNNERPHEALGMRVPADLYRPSSRLVPRKGETPGLDYPADWARRQVRPDGCIKWRGQMVFVSEVLAREPVALEQAGDEIWTVHFGGLLLGWVGAAGRIIPSTKRKKRKKQRDSGKQTNEPSRMS
jgi:putative transposase